MNNIMLMQNQIIVTMKCVQIALITAILVQTTFAQFDVSNSATLNISVFNSSNDLDTILSNLKLELNNRVVNKLVLNNVEMRNNNDFFKSDLLKKFPNLTLLHITKGKIEALPENIFEKWNHSKFKHLYLIDIGLENMSQKLLEPIVNMTFLNASYNELTYLPEDVFQAQTRLNTLDLRHNKLKDLPMKIFEPAGKLQKLYLQNNSITTLNEGIFSNLTKVFELDLSFNDFQYMHPNIFNRMNQLTELRMSRAFGPDCNSTDLPLLGNLSKLWNLYLDRNNIQKLPEKTFSGLESLLLLDLSNNKINFLASKTFEGIPHLKTLRLENNMLKSLDKSLFNKLQNLKYLNLANNQLTFQYGTEVFISLSGLNTIILDNNRELQLANSTSYNSKSILHNCSVIQEISARNTNISKIYEDWFILGELKRLDLMGTPVTRSQLNFTFQSKDIFLIKTSTSNDSVIVSNTQIWTPHENEPSRTILDKDENCGDHCSCAFYVNLSNEYEILLKCEHFDIEKLKYQIPDLIKRLASSHRSEFLIQNSDMTDLNVALIAHYLQQIKVTKLTLSHNKLSSVKQLSDQLANLEILALNNNNLTSLDKPFVDQLEESKTLKEIHLHGNKWDCRCGTGYFSKFVTNFAAKNKIPHSDKVLCSNGEQVQLYDEAKDCDITRYEIVYYAIIVALFAVACSIIVALYYRYELDVKIWMYHHREYLPSRFYTVDESFDRSKLYDAFVCYAQKDEEFVVSRLKPMLEDEHPKFKLCIHQRDWCPGLTIHEQIYKSVANSRRTIIVMSHNFLNSELCKQEFQVASDRSVQDKVGRVIVIMLEDIATHRLNDELKAYINKYTYIPWQDNDWFWNKLRYVLPHKVKIHVKSLNADYEIPSRDKGTKLWIWNLRNWFFEARKIVSEEC